MALNVEILGSISWTEFSSLNWTGPDNVVYFVRLTNSSSEDQLLTQVTAKLASGRGSVVPRGSYPKTVTGSGGPCRVRLSICDSGTRITRSFTPYDTYDRYTKASIGVDQEYYPPSESGYFLDISTSSNPDYNVTFDISSSPVTIPRGSSIYIRIDKVESGDGTILTTRKQTNNSISVPAKLPPPSAPTVTLSKSAQYGDSIKATCSNSAATEIQIYKGTSSSPGNWSSTSSFSNIADQPYIAFRARIPKGSKYSDNSPWGISGVCHTKLNPPTSISVERKTGPGANNWGSSSVITVTNSVRVSATSTKKNPSGYYFEYSTNTSSWSSTSPYIDNELLDNENGTKYYSRINCFGNWDKPSTTYGPSSAAQLQYEPRGVASPKFYCDGAPVGSKTAVPDHVDDQGVTTKGSQFTIDITPFSIYNNNGLFNHYQIDICDSSGNSLINGRDAQSAITDSDVGTYKHDDTMYQGSGVQTISFDFQKIYQYYKDHGVNLAGKSLRVKLICQYEGDKNKVNGIYSGDSFISELFKFASYPLPTKLIFPSYCPSFTCQSNPWIRFEVCPSLPEAGECITDIVVKTSTGEVLDEKTGLSIVRPVVYNIHPSDTNTYVGDLIIISVTNNWGLSTDKVIIREKLGDAPMSDEKEVLSAQYFTKIASPVFVKYEDPVVLDQVNRLIIDINKVLSSYYNLFNEYPSISFTSATGESVTIGSLLLNNDMIRLRQSLLELVRVRKMNWWNDDNDRMFFPTPSSSPLVDADDKVGDVLGNYFNEMLYILVKML